MNPDLDQLTPAELGRLFPIQLEPYNLEWPPIFEAEKLLLLQTLGSQMLLRVEHFGSTAIPGLAAKPTIDILAELPPGEECLPELQSRMASVGYHFMLRRDCPPPYPMFAKGYTSLGIQGQTYHVHMAPSTHRGLWERLLFRDYLISHPVMAQEYENLKKSLARRYQFDREAYTQGKSTFVEKVMAWATPTDGNR
jgi:GrpB-like predicted nucleotidyltransferase (UPF0157 family)